MSLFRAPIFSFLPAVFSAAVLSGALCLLLLFPTPGMAHRVNVFAWTEGGQVAVECGFSGGSNVRHGLITVFDAATGAKLLEGRTDEQGNFRFDAARSATRPAHPRQRRGGAPERVGSGRRRTGRHSATHGIGGGGFCPKPRLRRNCRNPSPLCAVGCRFRFPRARGRRRFRSPFARDCPADRGHGPGAKAGPPAPGPGPAAGPGPPAYGNSGGHRLAGGPGRSGALLQRPPGVMAGRCLTSPLSAPRSCRA